MHAQIVPVLIALSLAVSGYLLPDRIPSWVTLSMVALLVIGAIIQLFLIQRDRQNSRKSQYSGRLRRLPCDLVLSADEEIYPKLELGDSGAVLIFAGEEGQPLFTFFKDNHLTVERDGNRVLVSTSIFDERGNLVARLERNEWQVQPAASFDRNFLDDALEVMDSSGDIVLQVRLVEDRVQLQGKFYGPGGRGVAIGVGRDAAGNRGGTMEMTGTNNPKLSMKITPIFRYPSDLHMGSMITV